MNRYSKIVQNPYRSIVPFTALQTAVENRQKRYDMNQAAIAKKRDLLYNERYIDSAERNNIIKSFENNIEDITSKYGGDLSKAKDDLVNFITTFDKDNYFEKNKRHVEAVDLRNKIAANNPYAVFVNDPSTKSLKEYNSPSDIKVDYFDSRSVLQELQKLYSSYANNINDSGVEVYNPEGSNEERYRQRIHKGATQDEMEQFKKEAPEVLINTIPGLEKFKGNKEYESLVQPIINRYVESLDKGTTYKDLGMTANSKFNLNARVANAAKNTKEEPNYDYLVQSGVVPGKSLYISTNDLKDLTSANYFTNTTENERNLLTGIYKDKMEKALKNNPVNVIREIDGKNVPVSIIEDAKNKNGEINWKSVEATLERTANHNLDIKVLKGIIKSTKFLRTQINTAWDYLSLNKNSKDYKEWYNALTKKDKERLASLDKDLETAKNARKVLATLKTDISNYYSGKVGDAMLVKYDMDNRTTIGSKMQKAANDKLNSREISNSFNVEGNIDENEKEKLLTAQNKKLVSIMGNSFTGVHFIVNVDGKDYIFTPKDKPTFNLFAGYFEPEKAKQKIFTQMENYKDKVSKLELYNPVVKGSDYLYTINKDGTNSMIDKEGNYYTNYDYYKEVVLPNSTEESVRRVIEAAGKNPDDKYSIDDNYLYKLIKAAEYNKYYKDNE